MKSKFTILLLLFLSITGGAFAEASQSQRIYLFSKQNYYTSEKEVSIVCVLSGEVDMKQYSVQLFDAKRQKIGAYQFADSILHINLPTTNLSLGANRFNARIFNQHKLLKDTVVEIVWLVPVKNEVKIDRETGGLIVYDLPFFPFGFYCEKVNKIPEQEVVNGFNFIGPYQNNLPEGLPERKTYMDRCAQLGMKVQYGINSLIGNGHNGDKGLDKTEAEKLALLKSEILTFKDHSALLSWYINDEPDGQGRSPETLEKAYNLIHQLDPYHPIAIVFMMPSKFHLFGKTMDIAMTDPYPIPRSVDIRDYLAQMNHDFRYRKSVWLVPQAFGGQEMWPRESTPKELRVMTYLGLLEGAKGIQYFIRLGNNLAPQSVGDWSECSNIAVEISQMTPFLLSNEKQMTLSTGNTEILAKRFSYKGNRLVIVVNKANRPATFSVGLDNIETENADVWFENRQVPMSGNRLSDMIDALGTRVYLLRGKQKNNEASVYPGNIVYNPSFEEVATPGLATGQGRGYRIPAKADLGATVFTDSRQSVEGMFSLRMQTPADSTGKIIHLLPIILKAGDTYNVSVWAKALKQAKMPNFRLSVNSEKIEKSFETGTEWKKYSFMFKATTSSTNAIVDMELVNKGTAWFDLIQVVADPVASYSIGHDHKATVSISTISDNAKIKYVFSDTKTEHDYAAPFEVDRAVTVKALLYNEKEKLAESEIFVPVNEALGKPTHFEIPYSEQYPSIGDGTLTDGIMGTTSFRDKKWLGFLQPEVTFTVDMQRSTDVNSVIVNFLSDVNSGILLPREVSILVSNDGVDFKAAGQKANSEISRRGEPYLVPFEVPVEKVKARYIRLKIKTFGEIPEGYLFKGSTSWMFADEVLLK
jgi:hypothetical protein